jgi:hypothetical protein
MPAPTKIAELLKLLAKHRADIIVKEKLTRPNDQIMLVILRATLNERRRS